MTITRRTAAPIAALALFTLAACGSTQEAVRPHAAPRPAAVKPVTAPATPTSAPTSTASAPSGPPTSPTFVTPSGNITCRLSQGGTDGGQAGAECAASDKDWKLPHPDKHYCGPTALEGVAFAVGERASFLCATDVLVPDPARTLAYGSRVTLGQVSCWSRTTGVTCSDHAGHGFTVSRASYTLR